MAGTSKILTVSYGAFSCTLEGFDDPIEKMREVAEYYRELSARDRNFGALPTPDQKARQALEDARMVNRIAAHADAPVVDRKAQAARPPATSEAVTKVERLRSVSPQSDVSAPVADQPVGKPIASAFADVMPEPAAVSPQVSAPVVPSVAAAAAPMPVFSEPPMPPQDGDDDSMRTAIRGHGVVEPASEPAPQIIEAESTDMPPPSASVTEMPQPRGGLLSRLKGRFSGESRPRPMAVEAEDTPSGPPVSREPIVEKAEPELEEGQDPVDAALAQIVAAEQRTDRIERRHASTEAAQSDSLERIFAQTDTQLGEDDASRRRSTISQLKAAVAVTRAGGVEDEDEDKSLSRFRADLEQVVRPEKPAEPVRPSGTRRMAPLMLVSDQRIDAPSPSDALAARRTSGNLALAEDEADDSEPGDDIFVDTTPFIEYAATQQISGIEEMTEAAGAFSIFVLGQPHFSRSQLMQFVESALEPGEFSREGFLRAFGTLLRMGKVSKVKRGLFNLAPGSRFEP